MERFKHFHLWQSNILEQDVRNNNLGFQIWDLIEIKWDKKKKPQSNILVDFL